MVFDHLDRALHSPIAGALTHMTVLWHSTLGGDWRWFSHRFNEQVFFMVALKFIGIKGRGGSTRLMHSIFNESDNCRFLV